ncbi:hypothetical protein N7448_007935 [Penicillium atrosanguineum]|uniref:Uncharacterized protein n=1 Tax=Penicillium atrosanguineum TaxID=1132637 RepID=A0A9W9UCC9_9EURO|nr:hypothetical protein N7448_007935 [Penicillium atrosanguineum]KAJ5147361.1 hypothetical protein N7526_000713 [Penicillium atrosanguineum]KAJ5331326.1 hypothetical protein N7476_001109 [Penicillium atrosanguineum]
MSRGVKCVSNTMRPEATHVFWNPDDSGTKETNGPVVRGILKVTPSHAVRGVVMMMIMINRDK